MAQPFSHEQKLASDTFFMHDDVKMSWQVLDACAGQLAV